MQHAAHRAGDGQHGLHLATALDLRNQCWRHAREAQTLTRRRQQRGITHALERQKLFLRRRPFRHQNIRQRSVGFEHITGRKIVDTLDKARRACLNHRHITLIEPQHPGRHDTGRQHAATDRGQAHTEIFGLPRINPQRLRVGFIVGVLRHQLHVHKRRLARFIELLLREHRVIPVQRLGRAGCH